MKIIISELLILLKIGKVKVVITSNHDIIKNFLCIIFLALVLSFFSILITVIVFNFFKYEIPKNQLIISAVNKGVLYVFIYACILAPIFEELLFRLSLIFSVKNFSIMIVCFVYLIASYVTNSKKYDITPLFFVKLLVAISIGFIIYKIINVSENKQIFLNKLWFNNPKIVLYLSISLFAIPHIVNFGKNEIPFFLIPIQLLPQISTGIILCYTRLKYGIQFSFFLHMLLNSLILLQFL